MKPQAAPTNRRRILPARKSTQRRNSTRRRTFSLEGIRSVAPPEQKKNQLLTTEGISLSTSELLFALGEEGENGETTPPTENEHAGASAKQKNSSDRGDPVVRDNVARNLFGAETETEDESSHTQDKEKAAAKNKHTRLSSTNEDDNRDESTQDETGDDVLIVSSTQEKTSSSRKRLTVTIASPADSSDDEYFSRRMKATLVSPTSSSGRKTPTLQDEEALDLLDRLDVGNTRAEEKKVLEKVDQEIHRAEKKDLMQRLLVNIERDNQAQQQGRKKSSLVSHDNAIDAGQQEDLDRGENSSIPVAARKETPRRNTSGPLYENVLHVKQAVPKFLDNDPVRPLFSRAEFQTGVIDLIETDHFWEAKLHEDHPSDPHSYLLEAKGPYKAINSLKTSAEDWVQYHISLYKIQSLLEDGESLEVDCEIDIGRRLGALWMSYNENSKKKEPAPIRVVEQGVWLMSVKPDGGLAKAMCGLKAFKAGCAVLAINDQNCNSPAKLQDLILELEQKLSKGTMKVTLCFSKYSDFSEVNQSKIRIRRRDGDAYIPEYYKDLELESWVPTREDTPPPMDEEPTSWVGYPPAGSQPPAALPNNATEDSPPHVDEEPTSWMEYPPAGSQPPVVLPDKAPSTDSEKADIISQVLGDKKAAEVDILFLATEALGAKCFHEEAVQGGGVWLHSFSPEGQLTKALGKKACSLGGVLIEANRVAINDWHQLKRIQEAASNEVEGTLCVTLVLFDGTDLGDIDRTKLVKGKVNPRRRNGEPYPLHLYPLDCNSEIEMGSRSGQRKRDSPTNSNDCDISKRARTDRGAVASHANDKSFLYNNFKDKYKTLVEIEYGGADIHYQTACSSMWAQHKSLHGNDACDDECDCVRRLKMLTRNVVDDYIRRQRKKGNYVKSDSLQISGFVKYFAPRFMILLRKEYPESKPAELLQRLVDMWPFHQKHRMLGMQCREVCECNQVHVWEEVFCKGDKEKAQNMSSLRRRTFPSPASKKRRLTLGLAQTNTELEESATQLAPLSTTNVIERPAGLLKNYEISFDTYDPLGAYFVTDTAGPSGDDRCKIVSLWNKGQAKRDARIQPGIFCPPNIASSLFLWPAHSSSFLFYSKVQLWTLSWSAHGASE
jgi:hypothetical protein